MCDSYAAENRQFYDRIVKLSEILGETMCQTNDWCTVEQCVRNKLCCCAIEDYIERQKVNG